MCRTFFLPPGGDGKDAEGRAAPVPDGLTALTTSLWIATQDVKDEGEGLLAVPGVPVTCRRFTAAFDAAPPRSKL